jgi:ketosteroid isomerase-like protein
MRRALLLLAVLALPAFAEPTVNVQTGPPDEGIAPMVNAEMAFAKKALDTNIRDAFFENMDDEGIVFRPTPVNAKEFFRGRPQNPGPVLTWYPSYAEIAGSGDLGWTTGPWEYRSAKDKEPEAWGHFATVWRRGIRGQWKVLIDEGHSCPRPPQDSLTWAHLAGRTQADGTPSLAAFAKANTSMIAADAAYSKALESEGMAKALAAWADDDVRLLREDQPEFRGAAKAGEALEHEWDGGVTSWDLRPGAVARTADLGFIYGIATMKAAGKSGTNARKVFRVWHRKPEGQWRLALDVTNPAPPPPAPPKAPKKP